MGFAAFRGHPVPEPDIGEPMAVGGGHAVLAARFTPLEGFLAGSRTTSPWPLPPCRSPSRGPDPEASTVADEHLGIPPARSVDFGALLRRRVRMTTTTVADRAASRPSLGFVPLRGPSARPRQQLELSDEAPHAAKIRRQPRFVRQAPFCTRHDPFVSGPTTSLRRSKGATQRTIPRESASSPGTRHRSPFRRTTPAGKHQPRQ
jgi:hypothetical protein